MNGQIGVTEHLDRIRRVRSVRCPKCQAAKGQACHSPQGKPQTPHHAARYAALYRREGRQA